MLLHASCAVRDGIGVLIRGRAGAGKSSLLLRLFGHGFELVADDCVLVDDGAARAPDRLRGLIEVRGLGVFERSYCEVAAVRLVVEAGLSRERLPQRRLCPDFGQPLITLDLLAPGSPDIVSVAAACLAGHMRQVAGPL